MPPPAAATGTAVCAVVAPDGTASVLATTGDGMPAGAAPVALTGRDRALADRAYLPPGGGLLAAYGNGRYLVTDQGVRFPIADDAAVAALGYAGVTPVPVPRGLMSALPVGPTLATAAAGRAAP